MSKSEIKDIIIEKFHSDKYQKALEFPNNKINIISVQEHPFKIRILILDNDREFHLIIDEAKKEIFHDCSNFLIKSDSYDKICPHVIKVFLIIDQEVSRKIILNLDNYILTSEDFNSKKKSESFMKMANFCFESKNNVEGLSYLNKVIMNQRECEPIIERFIITSIENNLFIEFFDFLKQGYENDLGNYFLSYKEDIRKGFNQFMNSIHLYSSFNLFRIIESIDIILNYYEFDNKKFLTSLILTLKNYINSDNFNEKYFAFYFLKKYQPKINEIHPNLDISIPKNLLDQFKDDLIKYFLDQIDSFCSLEKLKLIKNHIRILEISEKNYIKEYRNYKKEIKELERKLYLKKFAYLKLLLEKHNVKKSKVDFRKERNTYIITHNQENLKNPAYKYIINHIGFVGLINSKIKSSEIGINYLFMKELFSDDFTKFQDIFYYHKQFWGDEENQYEINLVDGYSLMTKSFDYSYEIEKISLNIDRTLLIEWDLASKPRQGSIVNAYGSQIIIPDQNNPLFHDLKPFDLCYCQKVPVKIDSNIIKRVKVLKKCSFDDAIISVSKGMKYIEGYYPLSLVKMVVDKKISPFEAFEMLNNNPNKNFIPNFTKFIDAFKNFLFLFIEQEKEYVFDHIISSETENMNKFLILFNLKTELNGMELPYKNILEELINQNVQFNEFRDLFLKEINRYVQTILKSRKRGSTNIFNLKKMRHTPFVKYITQINDIRKEEFESSTIYALNDDEKQKYDISEINETYYGKKIARILKIKKNKISKDILNKFKFFTSKLKLNLNVED